MKCRMKTMTFQYADVLGMQIRAGLPTDASMKQVSCTNQPSKFSQKEPMNLILLNQP